MKYTNVSTCTQTLSEEKALETGNVVTYIQEEPREARTESDGTIPNRYHFLPFVF